MLCLDLRVLADEEVFLRRRPAKSRKLSPINAQANDITRKNLTPYMPDSARTAMPTSAIQPLPPYLRPDFAQSLERKRPHELVARFAGGKLISPNRCSTLQYRYLDTGETVTVPNIWYNQTLDMRVDYWAWHLDNVREQLERARRQLGWVQDCADDRFLGRPKDQAHRAAQAQVTAMTEQLDKATALLDDVRSGRRFV
jgi:hypothetical protein